MLEWWSRTPRKSCCFQSFLLVMFFAFFSSQFLWNLINDGVSTRARLWAVEWVGLESHQGIDGHMMGEGQALSYPRLALVKTLFCEWNKGGFDWAVRGLHSMPFFGPAHPECYTWRCSAKKTSIWSLEWLRFSQGLLCPFAYFLLCL